MQKHIIIIVVVIIIVGAIVGIVVAAAKILAIGNLYSPYINLCCLP